MLVRIESSWHAALASECAKPYFSALLARVETAQQTHTVYPPAPLIFAAFERCPLSEVKVVILGQDPYHGPGQAHGLAFSVPECVPIPPSLQNIYKEISTDVGAPATTDGNLTRWATQGVLLLNTSLTVAAHQAASHSGWGWERFTDAVIKTVNTEREHVVFLLWGRHAQAKASLIDTKKHLVLTAPHPSPLSAHRGFFGCQHFSKTNNYLAQHGRTPIVW